MREKPELVNEAITEFVTGDRKESNP